jgi:predicted phage tail protein
LNNLNKGMKYYFLVEAQNSAGWGGNSTIESTTPFGYPNEPTALSAIAGNAQVTLSWSMPNYTGPGTLSYHLFRDGVLIWSGDMLSHIDAGLTNGKAYLYKVSANNDAGWGLNSTQVQATPFASVTPGAPTNFHVTAGDTHVLLSWSMPTSSGSASVTSYKIYRLTNTSSMTLLTIVTSGTDYTDTAVTNGQNYYYQVRACSSVGDGTATDILSAAPHALDTPASPNENIATLVLIVTVLLVGAIGLVFFLKAAFFLRKGK